MASSMNNWLRFSLSPHEEVLSSQVQTSQECFDLTSHHDESTVVLPSLNVVPHDTPFGIFEAFNRIHHQSQDWNSHDTDYKTTSEMSMLMDSSCNSQHLENNQEPPKLENFLNWLRNNPNTTTTTTPSSQDDKNEGDVVGVAGGGGGNNAQSLSLSMSTGGGGNGGGENSCSSQNYKQEITLNENNGAIVEGQISGAIEVVPRKSIDTFGQRTSIYRGVTRHRWTGRYEAHLWDNSCRREGQTRKGRQGGYDKEEKAARAYDLAALKYWGPTTTTNFPISNYEKELEDMKHMTRQEYVASLRRHHQHGRWQARIGRVAGNKDLYLGTFSTQEEAAEAYDIAAIKFRGLNAVTNFEIKRYDVKSILESSTLPIGGAAKRLKDVEQAEIALNYQRASQENIDTHLTNGSISSYGASHCWPSIALQQAQPLSAMHNYPYSQQRLWCKQEVEDFSDHNMTTQNFQDFSHQFQHGNVAHNFMQPSSALHNLMGLDNSSSMDHNNVTYHQGVGYASNNSTHGGGGFVLPQLSSIIAHQQSQANGYGENEVKQLQLGNENIFGYYHSQQSTSNGSIKAGLYDHQEESAACNNWMSTAVPVTLASRNSTMAVCPTFTVWNDT
ncbi:hypothetical protein RND71_014929 [Anisodus tanguticus]|uniref:AP2/ERF domain-containing protein n=1 Tax=Anisodus tanguticus TaxID=243964 RepID=A0AAE1SA27_9SOLA|nr:hypothetical protein RND71_014929 [Anisodus tanguticus]